MNSLSNMFDKPTVGEKRRTGHATPMVCVRSQIFHPEGIYLGWVRKPVCGQNLSCSTNSFPPSLQIPKGEAGLRPAEPKKKDTTYIVSFLKCQINLDIYSPKDPDFCPAALLRRTSVFAAGENLGAGRIHCTAVGGFAALRMWRAPCGCFRPSM